MADSDSGDEKESLQPTVLPITTSTSPTRPSLVDPGLIASQRRTGTTPHVRSSSSNIGAETMSRQRFLLQIVKARYPEQFEQLRRRLQVNHFYMFRQLNDVYLFPLPATQ
jgi:hypothetical protein